MSDAELCAQRAAQEIEHGGELWAYEREVARLRRLLEQRGHELGAIRDAAKALVAEMRAEYVMKSHDSGRCVSADRVDDWVFTIERLLLKEPGQ